MFFKCTDFTGQYISWRMCCSSWLLIYFWESYALGYYWARLKNPWNASRVPDGIASYWNILWYPVWFYLPLIWCKSSTLQKAKASIPKQNFLHALQLVWYRGVAGLLINLPRTKTLLFKPTIQNGFFSLKDFISQLNCRVFVRLDPLEPFEIVFLPQQCFFSTRILPSRPASQSSSDIRCWIIFLRHRFSCVVMFRAFSLLSRKLMTDEIVLCIGKTGSI